MWLLHLLVHLVAYELRVLFLQQQRLSFATHEMHRVDFELRVPLPPAAAAVLLELDEDKKLITSVRLEGMRTEIPIQLYSQKLGMK